MADDPRLTALRAKADARRGISGYEENVRAIDAEIARLERNGYAPPSDKE